VSESWTKLHTLDLNEGASRFHGLVRSGELLMDTYQHELISLESKHGIDTILLDTRGISFSDCGGESQPILSI